jgi:hypothetical protein
MKGVPGTQSLVAICLIAYTVPEIFRLDCQSGRHCGASPTSHSCQCEERLARLGAGLLLRPLCMVFVPSCIYMVFSCRSKNIEQTQSHHSVAYALEHLHYFYCRILENVVQNTFLYPLQDDT